MEISATSGEFSARVNLNGVRQPHDADQRPFFQNLAATHTSALGYMFFARFCFCHLDLKAPIIFPF